MKRRRLTLFLLSTAGVQLALMLPGYTQSATSPLVSGSDPGRQILVEDFEDGQFTAKGPLFYKENDEQKSGVVTFQSDTVFHGKSALSLMVKPLCPVTKVPRGGAAVPEPPCSERAEIWEKTSILARYDQTVWYRFALNLAEPVPSDTGRYVLAQWKRQIGKGVQHDYSPFLALRLYGGKLGVTIETDAVTTFPIGSRERPVGCKPGEALVTTTPSYKQTRALVAIQEGSAIADYAGSFKACAPAIKVTRHGDLPSASARWVEFVFRSRPGPGGDGHIDVLANGKPVVTVRGRIGHEGKGLGEKQYFKFGPYRSASANNWTVHYDYFARGPRCQDVAAATSCPAE